MAWHLNKCTQLGGYPNPEARVTSAGGRLRSLPEKLVSPRVVWFGLSSPGGAAKEKELTGCYSGDLRGWGKLIGRRFVARPRPPRPAAAIRSAPQGLLGSLVVRRQNGLGNMALALDERNLGAGLKLRAS